MLRLAVNIINDKYTSYSAAPCGPTQPSWGGGGGGVGSLNPPNPLGTGLVLEPEGEMVTGSNSMLVCKIH